MESLGVAEALSGKRIFGNNVAQAHQFVLTGNAGLGFVALSQTIGREAGRSGWKVPEDLARAAPARASSGSAPSPFRFPAW